MIAMALLGVAFFIRWLQSPAGPFDLSNIPIRRNRIPYLAPFICILTWLILIAAATSLVDAIEAAETEAWRQDFFRYAAIAAVELAMIVFFINFARARFVRGLKGFGLDTRTIPKDLPAAAANLVTAVPFVLSGVALAIFFGRIFYGHEFNFQQSEGLVVIMSSPHPYLRILMVIFIVLVAPVFEEMLFRGMLQSMIQGFIGRPWISVILASVLFVVLHPQTHWLALFALSVTMGYAYEKSGSLFRPIFIHVAFNAINLTATMAGQG
jgi:membrane protease YdiL (CAAX protease family)